MAQKSSKRFSSHAFLTLPGPGKTIKTYPLKHAVFSQGDKADAAFYLQEGKIKLAVVSAQGKEAVVTTLEKEHFFGEQCLTGQTVRTATVLEEACVLRITQARMMQTLRDESTFSAVFLKYVLSHSLRVEENLVDQLFNSSEKRLARVLLLLANLGKKGKPQTAIPRVNQTMLAEMIGTTRPRVNSL